MTVGRGTNRGSGVDVLVVSQFFPPESMGGAHRWEKIAVNLDESVDAHVLCTFPTFPYGTFEREWRLYSRERVNGVPVTRLFTWQPEEDSLVARVLNYGVFAVLSSLYVLATFWRYDCVVVVTAPHTTFLPGLVGKLTGRTLVLDFFDQWLDNAADLEYVGEGSVAYRALAWLERVAFERADAVFVITETMGEFYEGKYPELALDVHVVPFGVDTELFSPEVEPTIETDVIYTGNLGNGQAFVPFIEGFAMLDGEPTMTIVGDGERREELEALVEALGVADRVEFLGYVDREEIPGLLAGAKVSIVPLKTEYQLDYALPTKLLESMAVGTPYVASAVKEIAYLSEKYGTGIAVKNEPASVEEVLPTIILDRKDREEMTNRGVNLVESQHEWKQTGQLVSDVLIRNTYS